MAQLFAAFGIDWRLLISNIVNFSRVLLALWYFLYEPLTRMLATRREKVAAGVRQADEAARHLHEIAEARVGLLRDAGKEADEVVAKARTAGMQKGQEIISASEVSAENLLKSAAAEAEELKAQAIRESKQEVAKLIVFGMERALIEQK